MLMKNTLFERGRVGKNFILIFLEKYNEEEIKKNCIRKIDKMIELLKCI